DSDHLCVLTRDGTVQQLLTSPYFKNLSQCMVYLDEVHTRGTDLQLPLNSRAAVTLGPKLSKDRLVQGMNFSPTSRSHLTNEHMQRVCECANLGKASRCYFSPRLKSIRLFGALQTPPPSKQSTSFAGA